RPRKGMAAGPLRWPGRPQDRAARVPTTRVFAIPQVGQGGAAREDSRKTVGARPRKVRRDGTGEGARRDCGGTGGPVPQPRRNRTAGGRVVGAGAQGRVLGSEARVRGSGPDAAGNPGAREALEEV